MVSPYLKWPDFSMRDARGLLTFGGQYMVSRMLWFFYSQADIFIAGKALGREALGFYSVAMHVASLPVRKDLRGAQQCSVSRVRPGATGPRSGASIPGEVGATAERGVVSGVVGHFERGARAGDRGARRQMAARRLPLQTLSLIMPLTLLSPFFNSAYQGLGFGGIVLRNVLTATVLMPIAFFVGIQWGLEGLALAWIIGFPVVFLVNLSRMLPLLGLTVWSIFASMAPALLSSAVMYGAVAGARGTSRFSPLQPGADGIAGCHRRCGLRDHGRQREQKDAGRDPRAPAAPRLSACGCRQSGQPRGDQSIRGSACFRTQATGCHERRIAPR